MMLEVKERPARKGTAGMQGGLVKEQKPEHASGYSRQPVRVRVIGSPHKLCYNVVANGSKKTECTGIQVEID